MASSRRHRRCRRWRRRHCHCRRQCRCVKNQCYRQLNGRFLIAFIFPPTNRFGSIFCSETFFRGRRRFPEEATTSRIKENFFFVKNDFFCFDLNFFRKSWFSSSGMKTASKIFLPQDKKRKQKFTFNQIALLVPSLFPKWTIPVLHLIPGRVVTH